MPWLRLRDAAGTKDCFCSLHVGYFLVSCFQGAWGVLQSEVLSVAPGADPMAAGGLLIAPSSGCVP